MAFMFSCLLFVFYLGLVCNGSDTLLPGQSLFSNQTLVSKGGKFEVGFFSPGKSTNYYLGIWYKNIPGPTVVQVFNRDDPIPYSDYNYNYSRLGLFSYGSLYLYSVDLIWELSTNVSEAVILDTGNLVARNGSGGILWQSFDYPTDTWLPGMKLYNYSYGGVGSWMNPNDPARGNYSLVVDSGQLAIQTVRYSTSFSPEILWSSRTFASLPDYSSFGISYNFTYFSNDINEYVMYNVYNESVVSRIVIDYEGGLTHFRWSEASQAWIVVSCNTHPTCRPNIICNAKACRCLDGFVPRVEQEWDFSDFSNGCVRTTPLECVRDKARYINVTTTALPDNPLSVKIPNDACNLACSGNCSCTAYAYDNEGGCLLFMGNLWALGSPPNNSVGVNLYVKTESTHTASNTHRVVAVALIVSITPAVIIACFCFCCMRSKRRNKESGVTHQNLLQLDFNSNVGNRDAQEKNSQYELPIFSFSSIAASTNNFSIANKLGEGGFGPVYKGELLNGEFVAVKRLSRRSGQGLEEFKNETELIAKLQHRNLVGILGCCTENAEMILVYEYLSNKSLDLFLFEQTKKEVLDWKRPFK